MACTRSILLAVVLGVLITDLGVHGGVTKNPRGRKRRSLQVEAAPEEQSDRARGQLNIGKSQSLDVGVNDDLILLNKNDSSGKPSTPAPQGRIFGGNEPSSSNQKDFGTPGRIPQLQSPHEITRTFFPMDPRFGPSTEVITVERVPQTPIPGTSTAVYTRVVQVLSTTTELYFSYLTRTVTTGVEVTERPTVTVLGNCRQPTVTRYVQEPTATVTLTRPVPLTHGLPPATFYFSTTSDRSDIVSKTNYNEADLTSDHATVDPQASSYTNHRTISTLSASGYDYNEQSKNSVQGRPSEELKKVRRAARTFVDDYTRTVLYS